MWADTIPLHANGRNDHVPSYPVSQSTASHSNGTAIRVPQMQGQPGGGPISFGGSVAEHMVQVAYNAAQNPMALACSGVFGHKGIGPASS